MNRQASLTGNYVIWFAIFAFASITLASAQTETVIHTFQSVSKADGAAPFGGLVADSNGALYGATYYGGKYGQGTVYKLAPPATQGGVWKQNILYSFTGGADGGEPSGSLLLDSKSHKIYGTTQIGGSARYYGVVYELVPPSKPGAPWTEAVLYNFSGSADGGTPYAGVISDSKGTLYGTTLYGGNASGTAGSGVIFRLSPPISGGGWRERVLHTFTGVSDGERPYAGLVLDNIGNLYGTTFLGGTSNMGTVFMLAPPSGGIGPWTESVLYSCSGGWYDCSNPEAGLIFDSTGALYGTTVYGGGYGDVFELEPPTTSGGAWTEIELYFFTGGSDGSYPRASVIFDSAGALYGTTEIGGVNNYGTAFKVNPPTAQDSLWSEQVLVYFNAGSVGAGPFAPLIQLGQNFYGTTVDGGSAKAGVVFEITP